MSKTRRNERCHCGSGQKYKHCCEGREKHPYFSRIGIIFGIAIVLVLAGGVAALLRDSSDDQSDRTLSDVVSEQNAGAVPAPVAPDATPETAAEQPTASPAAQPPGPAPDGKVWSAEHGHWHNAPTVQVESSRAGVTAQTAPEPGMVWNEEHGHYHRADGSSAPPAPAAPEAASNEGAPPATAIPRSQIPRISVGPDGNIRSGLAVQPPGPAPEGKVWSAEHGHWHDAQPAFPSGDYPAATATSDSAGDQNPQ